MPRRNRSEKDAPLHHIYFRGINHESIVRNDSDRENLLALWDDYAHQTGVASLCWALLDTHGHALVDSPIAAASAMLQRALSRYAQWFNARWGRRGNLFEDRFKSTPIFDSTHARYAARYVLLNPVGAGLCTLPALRSWPWTNIPDLLGRKARFRSLARDSLTTLFCGESEDLEGTLFDWLSAQKSSPDKNDIIYSICTHFGVSTEDIRGGSKDPNTVSARQAIACELHQRQNYGPVDIGKELCVSRATVFRLLRASATQSHSGPGSH